MQLVAGFPEQAIEKAKEMLAMDDGEIIQALVEWPATFHCRPAVKMVLQRGIRREPLPDSLTTPEEEGELYRRTMQLATSTSPEAQANHEPFANGYLQLVYRVRKALYAALKSKEPSVKASAQDTALYLQDGDLALVTQGSWQANGHDTPEITFYSLPPLSDEEISELLFSKDAQRDIISAPRETPHITSGLSMIHHLPSNKHLSSESQMALAQDPATRWALIKNLEANNRDMLRYIINLPAEDLWWAVELMFTKRSLPPQLLDPIRLWMLNPSKRGLYPKNDPRGILAIADASKRDPRATKELLTILEPLQQLEELKKPGNFGTMQAVLRNLRIYDGYDLRRAMLLNATMVRRYHQKAIDEFPDTDAKFTPEIVKAQQAIFHEAGDFDQKRRDTEAATEV